MIQADYLSIRSNLSQRLRDLREQRRMIRDMFKGTTDPDLVRAWVDWCQDQVDEDVRLSALICKLDRQWKGANRGEFDQITNG